MRVQASSTNYHKIYVFNSLFVEQFGKVSRKFKISAKKEIAFLLKHVENAKRKKQ